MLPSMVKFVAWCLRPERARRLSHAAAATSARSAALAPSRRPDTRRAASKPPPQSPLTSRAAQRFRRGRIGLLDRAPRWLRPVPSGRTARPKHTPAPRHVWLEARAPADRRTRPAAILPPLGESMPPLAHAPSPPERDPAGPPTHPREDRARPKARAPEAGARSIAPSAGSEGEFQRPHEPLVALEGRPCRSRSRQPCSYWCPSSGSRSTTSRGSRA